MLEIIQILLLLFTTILFHISNTNPNSSTTSDHVVYEGFASKLGVSFGTVISKFVIWSSTLYQLLYLYLKTTSSPLISTFFPEIFTITDPLPLTFTAVFAYILMIIGGLGRIWCYKTLGKFFTFEITIRNSHKLIKTGPYAYVRHPSYTFASILIIGMLLIHRRVVYFFPHRTWVRLFMDGPWPLTSFLIFAFFTSLRVIREEKELAKNFGKEWIDYSSKTKRFIPGLI